MLEITNDMKLSYDSKLGFLGFKVLGNDSKFKELLRVQKIVLGTEYNEFPIRYNYYDYNSNYTWTKKKSRYEEILMSRKEYNQLADSIEELKNESFNLYEVSIFGSEKGYSYYSKGIYELGSYHSVVVNNSNETIGLIIGIGGTITLKEIIEKGLRLF